MSPMIRISDGYYVAADLIAEIKANSSSGTITVRMKDDIGHCHSPDYKQAVYAALDALIAEVNSTLSPLPAAPKGGERCCHLKKQTGCLNTTQKLA